MGRLESFAAALSGGVEGYLSSRKQASEEEERKLHKKLQEAQIRTHEVGLAEKGLKYEREEKAREKIKGILTSGGKPTSEDILEFQEADETFKFLSEREKQQETLSRQLEVEKLKGQQRLELEKAKPQRPSAIGAGGLFLPGQAGQPERIIPPAIKPESGSGLEEMVVGNPELLKDLPPTERAKVLKGIKGKGLERQFLQGRNRSTLQRSQALLDTISQIRTHPGKLLGANRMTLMHRIPGSKQHDFDLLVNQFKAQATLSGIEVMKGLGSMSEAEFATVKNAMTALDPSASKEEFEKQLKIVEDRANTAKLRALGAKVIGLTKEGKEVFVMPDGQRMVLE